MEKVKYNDFKNTVLVLIEFDQKENSNEDIEQLCQDWYVIYKESKTNDPVKWIQDHCSLGVSRDTHSFWLSERGLMLMRLERKLSQIDNRTAMFQRFGF